MVNLLNEIRSTGNINNFIVSTLLNLLYVTLLFIVIFVLFKTMLKFGWIEKKCKQSKVFSGFIMISLGMLCSLLSIWYIYSDNWSITIFIFGIITISFFFNYFFLIGSLPIIILSSIFIFLKDFNNGFNDSSYILILNGIVLILGLLMSIISRFLKWRNNIIFLIANANILTASFIITFPLVVTNTINPVSGYDNFEFGINFIFYAIQSLLLFSLLRFIEKFMNKTETMTTEVKYMNGFIINKFANSAINDYIKKNKVEIALVIRFNIQGLDKIISDYGSAYTFEVKTKIINKLKEKFSQFNPFYYMQQNNSEYFCIIKIDDWSNINLRKMIEGNKIKMRVSNDILTDIQNIINDATKELKREEINTKIFTYCTLYGIDSNNIESINKALSNINIYNIGTHLNDVIYIRVNQDINRNKISKNKILQELNLFSPTDIHIKFIKKKHNNDNLYYVEASNLKPFLTNKKEILSISHNKVISSTIMCHISAKAIKQFMIDGLNVEHNYLMVDYPQYFLEQEDFSLYDLISRISSYGIQNQNFYLDINIEHLELSENFIRNVELLKNNDINISFNNVPHSISNKEKTKLLKFKPLFIEKETNKKYL